jgi:hypothetical protein
VEVKPPERKSTMMPAAFSKRCCPLRRDPLRGTHLIARLPHGRGFVTPTKTQRACGLRVEGPTAAVRGPS